MKKNGTGPRGIQYMEMTWDGVGVHTHISDVDHLGVAGLIHL